ncbi:MAG TPA: hypothetical protein VGO09_09485 [Flavisolibacter sp.]|nr:hypothetical protein [Flavisolibacter sp.]
MNFGLAKNIHFTKLVKTLDRLREFNFRMIPGSSNSLLHVDVPDDRGNRIIFKMHREENTPWKVVGEQLPGWITASEKNLNDLIEEELH